jgi:hypothetical protein
MNLSLTLVVRDTFCLGSTGSLGSQDQQDDSDHIGDGGPQVSCYTLYIRELGHKGNRGCVVTDNTEEGEEEC